MEKVGGGEIHWKCCRWKVKEEISLENNESKALLFTSLPSLSSSSHNLRNATSRRGPPGHYGLWALAFLLLGPLSPPVVTGAKGNNGSHGEGGGGGGDPSSSAAVQEKFDPLGPKVRCEYLPEDFLSCRELVDWKGNKTARDLKGHGCVTVSAFQPQLYKATMIINYYFLSSGEEIGMKKWNTGPECANHFRE